MNFTKMQGIGNDYVYVDCFAEQVDDPASLARAMSDRHFGVGADGLILVMPSTSADVRMRIFNADGDEAEMCGNGIRCVAKYAYDHGRAGSNPMKVQTEAGTRVVELIFGNNGSVTAAGVDMGEPILDPPSIPVNVTQSRAIDVPISAGGHAWKMTCVSMGNPHAVIFVDDVEAVALEQIGPELEHHPMFPQRVNAHFAEMISPGEVKMRTWERGSGITLACGTGASAVCVAGVLTARSDRQIIMHLPGGDLTLQWREEDNHVRMTGPAVEVFTGRWKQ